MKIWVKRLVMLLTLAAIAAGFYYATMERPALVDIAVVRTAPMAVSIEAEGTARIRDVFTISATVAGHLDRSSLEVGDRVRANQTVVASIHPVDPPFLDQRTRSERDASISAARAGLALARVELTRAQSALNLAQSEYARSEQLAKTRLVSDRELERAFNNVQLRKAEVASAQAMIRLRTAELARSRASLVQPTDSASPPDDTACCVSITAPVDGIVLKIITRSEQVIPSGAPIAQIGDPRALEVAIDLLSRDAVRVEIGSRVRLTDWGGDSDLMGTVRRIDPAAFTKVSALGIEEQRVFVIVDLDRVAESLGHGYRVVARLTVWESARALQVPIGALFRDKGSWSVFVVNQGRLRMTKIEIGQMNQSDAEVLSGLVDGDQVVLYPNDQLRHESLVQSRNP